MPPALLLPTGDWGEYLDRVYERFLDDLVRNTLYFQGIRIACQYRPESHGKHYSFWHLISEGKEEDERLPDPRRCERIGWIAWMIDCVNAQTDGVVYWRNQRHSNTHVVILHKELPYVVVLGERRDYFVLKTAYIPKPRRLADLIAEYDSQSEA